MTHLATRRGRMTRVAALLAAAVLLGACGSDETTPTPTVPPSPSPTDSPSPEETRTFEVRPVVAERLQAYFPLSSSEVLGFGRANEPDEAAINAVIDAVHAWLTNHLDDLQEGGDGLLDEVLAPGLAADPAERELVTTGLTSPSAPVDSARFVISVFQNGAPQFVNTIVEVARQDDTTASVTMVFVVGDDGAPVLTMYGPEPQADEEAS